MQVRTDGIDAKLGNKGITLYIADNDGVHVGKLRIGRATVKWCRGKTHTGNGKQFPLSVFVEALNTL